MCQCVLHLNFSRKFCDHLGFFFYFSFIFVINQKNYYRNCLTNSEIELVGLCTCTLLIIAFIHMKYTMTINSHISLRLMVGCICFVRSEDIIKS